MGASILIGAVFLLFTVPAVAEETQANWMQVQPLSQLNLCIPAAKHLDSAALTA